MTVNAKMSLYALPLSFLGGYGKNVLEGQAGNRDFQDEVEIEHGAEVMTWMKSVIYAVDHYDAIQQVLQNIADDDQITLETLLGGRANAHLDIMAPGNHPLSYVTPLTPTAHHDNWVSRRALLGPYATLTAPNLP